jgi:predicted neuraminidase
VRIMKNSHLRALAMIFSWVSLSVPNLLWVRGPSMAQSTRLIVEKMPTASCHASTIVEVQPGQFLAAWFGGSGEGRPDVAIWASRREGGHWHKPSELVRELNIATFNPVLFHSADGLLWLYYKFGPDPERWTAGRCYSNDTGRTWSQIEHLPAGLYGPIRGKPLLLEDGTIVSGTSVESYQSWACWVERSTDNGRSWTKHGPVRLTRTLPSAATVGPESHGIIQPVIVSMGGNWLRLYARATRDIGRICVSDSQDRGVTWSEARPTELPNPNSGIDAARLRDGRLVLVYNHTTSGRSPLNLAVSRSGDEWNTFHALETLPGEYSYPAIVQGTDGDLHITYTWNRKNIKYVQWPLSGVPEVER